MKRANIILSIIFLFSISSCNETVKDSQVDTIEVEAAEEHVLGLHNQNGTYLLDTSAILSNQNLNHLIHELEKENLGSKLTYQEAPQIVRSLLDSLTGDFDIANPGEDWQVGCVRLEKMIQKKVNDSIIEIEFEDAELPSRELVYLGTSDKITLMTYYTGGFGKAAHTLIIKHNNQEILDLWKGRAPYDAKNKTEIIEFLKQNRNKYWGLNTNILFL